VRLWDAGTGREALAFRAHAAPVLCVAFSPDGKRLASGGKEDVVRIWDATTGQKVLAFHAHAVHVAHVTFSPDGSRLASAGWDNLARLWDAATGRPLHNFPHASDVWSLAFSPDGSRLASASSDQTVKVWDAATGQEALSLSGHTGIVWDVAFSPDGSRLASASEDQTVRIWDAHPLTPEAPAERAARGLLEFLFAKPLTRADVIEYLQNLPAIGQPVREKALASISHYPEAGNPERLYQAGWVVARQPYLNPYPYRFALRQTEAACRLAPDERKYRTALGVAQYRAGQYPEAQATLTQADRQDPNNPAVLAFLAMAQYRLKRVADAKATLGRLRQALKHPRGAEDQEAQRFFREAAACVAGPLAGR
jgi:hypothetical protein